MSSRRKLKKSINESIDLLYTDCVFYKVFVIDADQAAADKVITRIVETQEEFLKRVNVNEGKEVKGRVKLITKRLKLISKSRSTLLPKK